MAANDEILGFSAQMNIDDIQRTIDTLIDGLDKIGLKTEVLSKRMNDAMNDIARSTDDSATKQKRAMDVLAQGIAEAKNAMANYPEQLRRAKNEADETALALSRMEANLVKLNDKLKETGKSDSYYKNLNKEIEETTRLITTNTQKHDEQLMSIQQMEAGYNSLVQLYNVGSAATLAQAAAKGVETTATTAASVAHGKNAEEIEKEGKAIEDTADKAKQLTEAHKEALAQIEPFKEEINRLLNSVTKNTTAEEFKEIKAQIEQATEKVREMEREQEKLTFDFRDEKDKTSFERWNEYIQGTTYEEATQKARIYHDYLEQLRQKVEQLGKQFNETGDSSKKASDQMSQGAPKQVSAYDAIQERIETLKTRLEQLQEVREKVLHIGQSDWMIPSAIAESGANVGLWGEEKSEAIRRVAADIDEVKKELAEAQQKAEDFTNAASQTTSLAEALGYDKMSISELLTEQDRLQKELSKWETELNKLRENKGFDEQSEKAKKLKEDIKAAKEAQQALNNELEGRPGYQKFFNSLREGFKGLTQNIKNTFAQLKGGFTGGNQGISGIFSLVTSGKFLGWTAGIAAVGGSIKGLSDSAERLKLALDPLKAYVNGDTLDKLRQSFIDTALAGSAHSTEDMSAAALKWIKYYDSIKDVPDAIMHVVDASRELATVSGTSAEKAAETLTKLGGQFHLTADEAIKSVNVLVNASHDSTVNINELIQALTASGARVNQNGATLKEYAAAISLTSSQYGSASQAASAFQRILQRLSTETNDNFNPKVVGVTKAFQNLKKEMESGTDLSKKFGKMVWSQAQYFIKNADAIADYTDKLSDATAKENALARAEETAAHNKAELSNAVSALAQSINLNLTPAFSRIVRGITNFVTWCGKAINKAGELKEQVQNWLGIKSGNEKPTINWTAGDTREQYRRMLRDGNPLTASAELISAYKNSNSTGLTIDEVRQIIREENDKWKATHPALTSATTKGEGNTPGKDNSVTDPKAQKALERQVKTEEDLAKRRRKYQQEQAEQRLQATRAEQQAIIAEMGEGYNKERRQMELDHKKRLDDLERQKKQMVEKNIEYVAAEYDKTKKKDAKGFYARMEAGELTPQELKAIGLNEDQQREYDANMAAEYANYEKIQKDFNTKWKQQNQEAINELTRQFGDYSQKKALILQEEADKIAEIRSKITKDSTEEEKAAAEASIEITKKETQVKLEELNKQYGKSVNAFGDFFADMSKKSLRDLSKLIKKYEAFLKYYNKEGVDKKDLKDEFGFTDSEIEEATEKLKNGSLSLKEYIDRLKELQKTEEELNRTKAFVKIFDEMQEAFEGKDYGEGLVKFGELLKETASLVSEFGQSIGTIFNFDESEYKDLETALNSVGSLAQGIGQMYSGNYIGGAASILGGIAGFVSMLSNEEGERESRQREENRLTSTLQALSDNITKLNKTIEKSYGAAAIEAGLKRDELIRQKQSTAVEGLTKDSQIWNSSNVLFMMSTYGQRLANAAKEIGSKYGLDYLTEYFRTFSDFGSWEQILSTTEPAKLAEILKDIRDTNEELWGTLMASDAAEYFKALADSADELEESLEDVNKQLTTTTENDVFNNFLNSLYNLADGSKDVFDSIADDWQKMVNRMAINNLLSEDFKTKLKKWYSDLVKVNKEFSETKDEAAYKDALKGLEEAYKGYVQEAQNTIEQLRGMGIIAATGENSDKNATYNSLEKWTYDQADEIINRATAIQIIAEHIYDGQQQMVDATLLMSQKIEGVSGNVQTISDNINTAVELHRTSNDYLGQIVTNTNPIAEIRDYVKKLYNER